MTQYLLKATEITENGEIVTEKFIDNKSFHAIRNLRFVGYSIQENRGGVTTLISPDKTIKITITATVSNDEARALISGLK